MGIEKDKILELLEKDYMKLKERLSVEKDSHKQDFVAGAMGYILNLKKEINKCYYCGMPEEKCLCLYDEEGAVTPICPTCGERMDNCMCGEEG